MFIILRIKDALDYSNSIRFLCVINNLQRDAIYKDSCKDKNNLYHPTCTVCKIDVYDMETQNVYITHTHTHLELYIQKCFKYTQLKIDFTKISQYFTDPFILKNYFGLTSCFKNV